MRYILAKLSQENFDIWEIDCHNHCARWVIEVEGETSCTQLTYPSCSTEATKGTSDEIMKEEIEGFENNWDDIKAEQYYNEVYKITRAQYLAYIL